MLFRSAVKFLARQLDDGRIELAADYLATPAPVATSYALRNALTIERVVEIVNEGSDELTSSELAGQYAEQAAHEAGYAVGRNEIEAHLEFLESAGAAFNFPAAIKHGLELSRQRQADIASA